VSISVSVIIPVHDGEAYLADAIDSVLAQSVPPSEVLVIDDGSTDGSAEIAEGYRPPVRCIRNGRRGPGAALNRGTRESSGEFVAYIDDDDLWTPRKLEVQLASLERDPDVELAFGRVEEFHSPDLAPEWRERIPLREGIAVGFTRGTMLVRRRALERVGGWLEDRTLGEFIDWYARAQDLGLRHEVVPEVVLRRRIHRRNYSGPAGTADHGDYPAVLREVLRRRRRGAHPEQAT
jgi:glycosyltransferase involved in cell wall biosynthesis